MVVNQGSLRVSKILFTIYFFFFLPQICLFASRLTQIDSLKHTLDLNSAHEKSEILVQLAYRYAQNEPDSALFFLDEAIRHSVSSAKKGEVYFEKAMLYRFLGQDQKHGEFLDSTFNLLTGVNDSIAAEALYYKHMHLANRGLYKDALQVGLRELDIRKKLPSRDKELNAILQIGYTYDRIGEYRKAIEWYEKGLKIKGIQNHDYIGRNYGLIGIAYDELKDYQKAISYNLIAIDHFKKKPNSVFLHAWYSNIGNTYTKMGELEQAEKFTLLALEDTGNTRYVTKINLGKIYIEQGNLKKAENVLKSVLEELLQTNQVLYLSEVYLRLNELYRKRGDFESALSFFEKYKLNEDERLSIEKVNQLNELTIQYETAEKENQILIQKAQIAEDLLLMKTKNQWILGLLALAVIIGLLGFLFFKQQVLKNIKQQKDTDLKLALEKIETQNKLQEQRLLIARDLHDNIGAQLSFIVSSIYTTKYYISENNHQLASKLSQIGTFANEAIQELRDTIWAMNKSEISIKDLRSRIANFIEKGKHSKPEVQIELAIARGILDDTSFTSVQGLNSFRIIQEAINNALKYADPKKLLVEIKNDNGIQFLILDDGNGFIEENIEAGNGLANMRKRAQEIGSELILFSELGKGTCISFGVKAK